MDYSKTLNLPEIDFPVKSDPARTELEILSVWEDLKPYEKRQRLNKTKPGFFIHNSLKPVHDHICLEDALEMILKDITVKYKLMCGFNVPSIPGWNCHTPAIEREALQLLESKNGVQKSELLKRCRSLCSEYVDQQKEQYHRLGIFAYWDKAVLTSDSKYGAKMIRAFADLYEAGYLYKGAKPTRWCINCQTDLSRTEIEYKDHKLLSLYVKFPVIQGLEDLGEDVYMVVWTNAPWTLPANIAITVHPDHDYVAVETADKEVLIMAADVMDNIAEKIQGNHEIIRKMKGLELDKIVYAHPFLDRNSDVFLDRSVSMTRGTGCVHAVSESGQRAHTRQDAKVIATVDKNGQLTEEAGQFCSLNVFESIDLIALELEKRGCLLTSEVVDQPYPYCLYCDEPTIVRLAGKWMLNLNANDLRQRVLKTIDELDWVPGWNKDRISNSIARRSDWSISRQRVWGIPVPVFFCNKCDSQVDLLESINSSRRMIEKRGANRWIAAKPNSILSEGVLCSRCGGKDFRRGTEMLDTGFISAMSYKMMPSNGKAPLQSADIFLGSNSNNEKWFQSSLLPSIAIEDSPPFRSVLMHGVIVDEQGKRVSESRDDALSVENLLESLGADILRLWITSMDSKKRLRISHSQFEVVSSVHQHIRNTCRFMLANLSGYDPESDRVDYAYLQEVDRWALHKLAKFVASATKALESSQFHRLYNLLRSFCSVDMSSLYFNIVRRRLYTSSRWASSRRSVQTVIYEVLIALVKVMAPILSFTAEEIWCQLPAVSEECPSIFLSHWPDVDEDFLDDELESRWDQLLKIRTEIYRSLEEIRQEEEISNFSQASVILYASSQDIYNLLDRYIDDLEEIFTVSKVRLTPPDSPVPDGVQESNSVEGLAIEIRRIAGEKCERCWVYSDTVGTNEQYPTLCYRCIAILEGGTHYI
ncbi:isoleucine--tRNA ligase [Candidatus Poribacteria bacterium]